MTDFEQNQMQTFFLLLYLLMRWTEFLTRKDLRLAIIDIGKNDENFD
jgi:hypothetical protein